VHGFPSVYGHLSTFSAGPHACIGYRFTIAECVYSTIYVVAPKITHPISCRMTAQSQSFVVHVSAGVRVRAGPASGRYRVQVGGRQPSCCRVESGCRTTIAATHPTGEHGLNTNTVVDNFLPRRASCIIVGMCIYECGTVRFAMLAKWN
jgi:hypothetical protein